MKKNSKAGALGIGLAALAAAAAGTYFLYEKSSPKTKKKIKGWMLKMKGEVLEGIETMQNVSESTYKKIVDEAGKRYKAVKDIDKKDVDVMMKELKGHWRNISRQMKGSAEKPARKSKKS